MNQSCRAVTAYGWFSTNCQMVGTQAYSSNFAPENDIISFLWLRTDPDEARSHPDNQLLQCQLLEEPQLGYLVGR
jgi:hypothetical protein